MSQESNKVVPLSQANNRKPDASQSSISDTDLAKIGAVIEKKLDSQNSEFARVNEELRREFSSKFGRLEKSMNLIACQFEAMRTGESEDASLRVTTDSSASDLALAEVKINSEDYYTYVASLLAEKLNVRIHDITNMVKMFKIKDNPDYHKKISTGKKSHTNKFSEEAYLRLKQAIDSGEYSPKPPKE